MTTHAIETISACEKRISVTVDAKTVKKAISAKVLKKANNLKQGGFRPTALVTQQLVAKQITSKEVADIHQKICNDSFSSIAQQEKISYQGTPILQDVRLNADKTLSYTVLIEVYPDIPHVHWEGVKLEKLVTQITEADISSMRMILKERDFDAALESNEAVTQWCEWVIKVFQHQQLRSQVIEALIKQNQINALPSRLVEARYQALRQEHADSPLDDVLLKEMANQYIAADILLKAYALEHSLTVDRETLIMHIQEAEKNPFIMNHIKDATLLPYYLAPRIFEETVINHVVKKADCTTNTIPLQDFMALVFNTVGSEIKGEGKPE